MGESEEFGEEGEEAAFGEELKEEPEVEPSREETVAREIEGEKKQEGQEEPQTAQCDAGKEGSAKPCEGSRAPRGSELEPKRIIEAALFISSKPIPLELLGKFVGVAAPGFVEGLVRQLADEYDAKGSAIRIVSEPGGYIMRLRGEYASKVASLAQEAELSKGALKILGYISQNEGIEQSMVANRLGSGIYDYVRELVDKGFISKEKKGRTSVLKTTQKFRDYFGA